MEFKIIDRHGHTWELYFADSDGKEGTLFFMGQSIGRYTEAGAIQYIERETGGKIKSSERG